MEMEACLLSADNINMDRQAMGEENSFKSCVCIEENL